MSAGLGLKRQFQAAIALLLVVGAAVSGMAARLYVSGGVGRSIFVVTRGVLLGLPLAWFLGIDRDRVRWVSPSRREIAAGTTLGLAMAGVILLAYLSIGRSLLDAEIVRDAAALVGLTRPLFFLGFAVYFTVINALVEEYVWRWFVYQKCAVLVKEPYAVYLSALCFTLHHIIALAGYTGNTLVTIFGSLGVFGAGAIWSLCFLRYQSLWACYVSHALADLAIALIGWDLLFLYGVD
ncbi:MAG: CPBP family intramembrane metalloprotease [Synechococcales cyanobacterium T60_A2020_003]|nr:CPBP family intramembrane metalloprotease [Synechococcales cyanobacterium T60_A2020_003]